MKPRTLSEKHITTLSDSLAPITPQMQKWAEQNLFLKWGVLSRGKFHCLDCAHSWKPESGTQSAKFTKCTACQGKLKMHGCNQLHFKEIEYSAVVTTVAEFQVVRIICSHKNMKKNTLPDYFHKEVMQHWIDPKGEVRTRSLSTNVFSHLCDAWQYYSALEIRPKSFEGSPKYNINPYKVFPRIKVLPVLKRNGFKKAFYAIAPQVLLSSLLNDPYAETLLKSSQVSMLRYYLQSSHQKIARHWQSVKICLKNKYVISDFSLWEDYIELLKWFKKDLCSARFVCPENLSLEHDRLVQRKRAIQRKKHLQELRSEIEKAQGLYTREKKQFFGLCFKEADITIQVLENVADFLEEGDSLKHCVFTSEYYKRKDSLLFSARIDNKPVETIELSLSKMEIAQCRGMKNNISPHHKAIMSLLNKNLYQVRSRLKKQKSKPI